MRHYSRQFLSPSKSSRLPLPVLLLLFSLSVILFFQPRFAETRSSLRRLLRTAPLTKCVIAEGFQNNEGIGQALKRNQFAIFVAQMLNARLALPDKHTGHNYSLGQFFDHCEAPNGKHKHCELNLHELLLDRCERGDCDCLESTLAPYVQPLAERCPTISVMHDKFKTQEYSGCISQVLTRYLGGANRWPRPYNAIHYRQGDLAEKHNSNKNALRFLYNQVNFMCKHSQHDIIVVTEGEPEVPTCENRVVLAGNTTIQEAFSIMQHADWIGVGKSGFAIAMMQIATPQRVLMEKWVMPNYDWVNAPSWTVFNQVGAAFNFKSTEEAFRRVYSGAGIDLLTYKNPSLLKYVRFDAEVPQRRWKNEALES